MKVALNKKIVTAVFLLAELTLAILVQLIGGAWISFSAIALAFLYALIFPRRDPVYLFFAIALLFTTLADVCLVLLEPREKLLGMVFFTITQLSYFIVLLFCERKADVRRVHCIVRLLSLVVACVLTAVVLGQRADALAIISVLYYTNLIVSIIFAFILTRGGGKASRFLLPIGLLFFAVCDFFIGFAEISPYFTINVGTFAHFLANPPFNIAWLFYIPSQTILAMAVSTRMQATSA